MGFTAHPAFNISDGVVGLAPGGAEDDTAAIDTFTCDATNKVARVTTKATTEAKAMPFGPTGPGNSAVFIAISIGGHANGLKLISFAITASIAPGAAAAAVATTAATATVTTTAANTTAAATNATAAAATTTATATNATAAAANTTAATIAGAGGRRLAGTTTGGIKMVLEYTPDIQGDDPSLNKLSLAKPTVALVATAVTTTVLTTPIEILPASVPHLADAQLFFKFYVWAANPTDVITLKNFVIRGQPPATAG